MESRFSDFVFGPLSLLCARIPFVQVFHNFVGNIVSIVCQKDRATSRITENNLVALALIILFQIMDYRVAQLLIHSLGLLHQLLCQSAVKFLQFLLLFHQTLLFLLCPFARSKSSVLQFVLKFFGFRLQTTRFLCVIGTCILLFFQDLLVQIDGKIVLQQ